MKLYETRTAPNPRRVRIFLAEKGLLDTVELIQIDLQKGENLTSEFAARNPLKKVPVLELPDGSCVAETMAICRYFEEAYPDSKPLLGRSALEKPGLNSGCAGLITTLWYPPAWPSSTPPVTSRTG